MAVNIILSNPVTGRCDMSYEMALVILNLEPLYVRREKLCEKFGVATFVQGTDVQGDHGPRGQMSKGQLSKEISVRGDFCPRKLLPLISLLKLFFFILYWILQY